MRKLGIDIGGTSIKYGIVEELNVISNHELVNNFNTTEDFTNKINSIIDSVLKTDEIKSVGIAFPGSIDKNGYIKSAPNLSYLEGYNLYESLYNSDLRMPLIIIELEFLKTTLTTPNLLKEQTMT
jgi:predicted NBD/HSP70 family sugar kinase